MSGTMPLDDARPSSVRFDVLGPLRVSVSGREVALGGGRQRTLLLLLLVHAGEVVSRDRLVERLWAGDPTPAAGRSLDAYVSRVRRALREAGGDDVLLTQAPGYRLLAVDTDVAEFEAAVQASRHAGAQATVDGLDRALRLWRGPAYAEVADEPWAYAESRRLEELRLQAHEMRIEAGLALGRHADLVGDIEALGRAHPTRERLTEQLMLALYRSGRQTEALAAYRRARDALVEDLGVEPGPALRRREAQVLADDPALDVPPPRTVPVPAPTSAPEPAPTPPGAPPRRPSRRRLAVAAAAVVALVATGVGVAATRSGTSPPRTLPAQSLGALDPGDGRVLSRVDLGTEPAAITSAGGRLWVTGGGDGTLLRIDPRPGSRHVDQTVRVGSAPSGQASGFGAVWVANAQDSTVSRVDVATAQVVQTIAGAERPVAIATGVGSVWVADAGGGQVVQIDPRSGAAAHRITLSDLPAGIAVGFGSVWVSQPRARRVLRLDPGSGAILDEIDVGGGPGPLAVGAGAVWVVNRLDATLSRIDPGRASVTSTVPVGEDPHGVVATDAAVYAAGSRGVTVIDARTGTVRRRFATGSAVAAVAVVDRQPWVATSTPTGSAHRGGELRVVGSDPMRLFDPAASDDVHPAFWRATGDGLTALVQDGGMAQLVPDLAVALPRAADAGRVYRFRLRPGIRYSDGTRLRAADVRRGLERAFTADSNVARALGAIAGATSCSSSGCDLSAGVRTDDRAGTVEIRLSRPDPHLLDTLAEPATRPVPAGTRQPAASRFVPGTGPYRVVRLAPGSELVLERNPYFRAWSVTAQPDGFADRIVYRVHTDAAARTRAVLDGRADLALDIGSAPDLGEVTTRYASQVRRHLQPMAVYATLNVRKAPFDDVRARRALDLALDRAAAVRAFGGEQLASPTCQVLPPTIAGHAAYCPRTRPPRDGAWHGTDLGAARALVRSAGTRGARADFVAWTSDPSSRIVAQVVVHALRQLGYRSRAILVDDLARFASLASSGRFAVSQATWVSSTPSDYLETFLACRNHRPDTPGLNTNAGGYCNARLDRTTAAATAADADRPGSGARRWAEADRIAIDDAALVPIVDLAGIELLSRRAGHFTLDATSQPRIDQIWVR